MKVKIKGLGTIQGSKETLNLLSMALEQASELQGKKNHSTVSSLYGRYADDIYTALKMVGYYD